MFLILSIKSVHLSILIVSLNTYDLMSLRYCSFSFKTHVFNFLLNQGFSVVSSNRVTALHRPEKKKRKKLMKDSLYLAAMLRRFTREKEEMSKRNPNMAHPGLAGGVADKPHCGGNSTNHLLVSNSNHLPGNTADNDLSLADLTSDPTVMSLLGSANEKELQELLSDLDFSFLETDQQHAMVTAREKGILGVGVPSQKAGGGGGQGRGLASSSGLFSPPPLPSGLPAPLIKRIEDLRAVSQLQSFSGWLQVPVKPLHLSCTQMPFSRERGMECLLLLLVQ